jgi:hypothetical protein
MSAVNLVFLAGLVKGLVDGIKRVIPPLDADERVLGVDHFWAKLLTVVLSGIFVTAYNFNLPKSVGAVSAWLGLDYAVTVVSVALSAMGVNDIGNIWGAAGKTSGQVTAGAGGPVTRKMP